MYYRHHHRRVCTHECERLVGCRRKLKNNNRIYPESRDNPKQYTGSKGWNLFPLLLLFYPPIGQQDFHSTQIGHQGINRNLPLFHLHSHVIHYEAVDVGCLFHHLRQWFAAAMACLAVDTDQDRGLACLTLLQTGSELERMGRNHTVVVAKAEAINSVFIRI